VKKIAVIGAGTMGIGVSVDLVLHDYQVVLVDIHQTSLDAAAKEFAKLVRFAPMWNKKLTKKPADEAKALLELTTRLEQVKDCDFVIENVPEKWETKEPLYRQLDEICAPHACFCANTSCLSITQIGAVTRRPEKVLGIHFANPVFLKPVVEVMRGMHTSEETLANCTEMLAGLNKEAVVVGDMPGFVTNRVSHLFMNEAMWVVQDGVATAAQVDKIFTGCFGHKMGPLETADLIGLDVVMDSLAVLYESYQDPKFRCCPLLRQMVVGGKLGRKSGQGFFEYAQ